MNQLLEMAYDPTLICVTVFFLSDINLFVNLLNIFTKNYFEAICWSKV